MTSSWRITVAAVASLIFAAAINAQPTSSRGDTPSDARNNISITTIQGAFGAAAATADGIVRVDETAFIAGSGLITFSEVPINTENPGYAPGNYGGDDNSPVVSFGGYFQGQHISSDLECPAGAAATGCVSGTPVAPLALDPSAPVTRVIEDGSNPTSPVLSGTPDFDGPIAILFDKDQAGVGLDGGYFDNSGGTAITAFARDGTVLGSVTNTGMGIEFLGLVTADGSNRIAGLLFSLVGAEGSGFAIDNLRFGTAEQVEPDPGSGSGPNPNPVQGTAVPVPATGFAGLALLLLLLAALGAFFTLRR